MSAPPPPAGRRPAAAPELHVRATVAPRGLDLDLRAEPGRVLAVLGANGAGKSSLVHLVSGLLRPDAGTVTLGGRDLTGPGVWVPPHRRRIGLLAQDDLLFPHLSVLENVAFGPRARGERPAVARRIARARLADVDAAALADRRPAGLSGGQRRRVSLARALAGDPALVLLDEPLAALDVEVAARLRRLLAARLRDGRHTVVLVTHDLLDVLALADDVAVLEGGRVVEQGPAVDLLRRPRSRFLARLAGVVLLPGVLVELDGAFASLDVGGTRVTGRVREDGGAARAGDRALASFRPTALALHPADAPASGSPRNVLELTVVALEPLGGTVRVHAALAGPTAHGSSGAGDDPDGDGPQVAADVTPAAAAELGLVAGSRVRASLKATEVDVDLRP